VELVAYQLELARVKLLTGPDPTPLATISEEAQRALALFEKTGDHARSAEACYVLVHALLRSGAVLKAEATARRALIHAQRSGSAREDTAARWNLAMLLRLGPTPLADAMAEMQRLASWRDTFHPGVLAELAVIQAMAGTFDDARERVRLARDLVIERLRLRRPLIGIGRLSGQIELLAGDLDAAGRELRDAFDLAAQFSERDEAAQIAGSLARLLSAGAQWNEADRFAKLSRDYAPAESIAAQASWRASAALVSSHRGRDVQANNLAREAIDLVPEGLPSLRTELLGVLAGILASAGDLSGAQAAREEALRLADAKGERATVAQFMAVPEGKDHF
jgi:tetratricopeptide (TPR) repeat protein